MDAICQNIVNTPGCLGESKQPRRPLPPEETGSLVVGRRKKRARSNPRTYKEDAVDFWVRVKVGGLDQCWPWLKGRIARTSRPHHQYGAFVFDGIRQPTHRISYQIVRGAIPSGSLICHTCDNAVCCNPLHLYAGSHQSNMDDRSQRNRANAQRGSSRRNAKLTEEMVAEIRRRYAAGNTTHRRLAVEFGVGQPRICKIIKGYIWKHVMQ